ncbi:hypothetical protein ACKAV7_014721 [Fusarium commune]
MVQYDVVNAFVNAPIDQDIFMHMAPGYKKTATILKLNKALYGLRASPLLWQKELSKTLLEIGYTQIPHEPCCFKKEGVLFFVYVDDVIIAYRKARKDKADELTRQLGSKYKLTGGDPVQWFLGMEVIRDRPARKIWLSQTAYIDKIANLANKGTSTVPMTQTELRPQTGLAAPAEIQRYQRKVGSILYIAVNTRPDIAFAASRLARFLVNPGQEHQDAADRVIHYLSHTRHRALRFGGPGGLTVASDASFADNTLDRKSSQAYTIRLFDGLIGWRASKQNTVTTSTTEAELLALAQAAKESLYVSRLLKELTVQMDDPTIRIDCDNTQTINLVTAEIVTLKTKLRHVDIHNHWLRQEVQGGRIQVKYTKSTDMIADGLTKALPAGKWNRFLYQLGLEDIQEKQHPSIATESRKYTRFTLISDITAWVTGPTAESNRDGIRKIIRKALDWEKRSGATFETEKTAIIHFTRKEYKSDEEPFAIRGQLVRPKTQVKVLGMIMDAGLKYKEHIARAAAKGLNAAMELQRLRGLTPRTARQLFAATVAPVVDYASNVWMHACRYRRASPINRVQRIGANAIVGTFLTVAISIAEAEAHIASAHERFWRRAIKMWTDLHALPTTNPLRNSTSRIRKFRRYNRSPFYEVAVALSEIPMEELETINPFTLAPWVERVQTIVDDGDSLGTMQADLGWAVRAAVSSSARNGVVGVGGVIEIPASVRGGPKLERFSFTLGMRTEQNPFSGQLAAMAYALRHLPHLEYRSVALLASNKAAVLTVRNPRQQSGQEYVGCIYDSINVLRVKGNVVAVVWMPISAEHRLLKMAKKEARSASQDGAAPAQKFPRMRSTTLNIARSSQRASKRLPDNVGKFSKKVDAALPEEGLELAGCAAADGGRDAWLGPSCLHTSPGLWEEEIETLLIEHAKNVPAPRRSVTRPYLRAHGVSSWLILNLTPDCPRLLLGIKCAYAASTAPATTVTNPGHWPHSDAYEAAGFNIIDPSFSISNSSIASLLVYESSIWSRTMNCYFETVNSCLTVIHPKLFAARTKSLDLGLGVMPDSPVTLLLMVCMQIVTQTGHDQVFECSKTIQSDVYDAAKRILGILRGLSPPCIELIQCTILLALVELKHGDNMRAYISIGDAYTLALAIGIRPGKYIEAEKWLPVSYNEEERRCVYWSLLVLDCLVHIDSNLTHIPLQVAAPTDDDLLPTTNVVWDNKTQTQTRTIQRNPANEPASVPLGAFQRKCQLARLYTEVLCPQPRFHGAGTLQNSLAQLHIFTHAVLDAMVLQSNHWGGFHEAIAYSSCSAIDLTFFPSALQSSPIQFTAALRL